MAKIQINGMDFSPRADCDYKNAYVDWINMAENTEELLRRFPQIPAENLTKDNFLKTLLRQWVLTDLWFVVYFVLGIKSANHPFVVNLCREIENGPKTKTLDVIARGHFKSTAITKAETISYHLANPEHCTIIFSYKKPLAETFLKSIKQCFESAFLKELFPDVLYGNPDKESSSWSVQNGITVRRRNKSRSEPTVYASGLTEGMATGFHVERRIFDDIEVGDMAGSADVMNDVFEKFALSSFLGTKSDDDVERIVGTFYHHGGPLARIKDIRKSDGGLLYHTRVIPGTDDGQPNGKPVFWTQDVLDMEKPLPGFYSQILCDPTPRTARRLNPEFLHSIPHGRVPRNLYRFIVIDPAGSDGGGNPWAILLIGVQPQRDETGASNVYILDACITKMGQTAAIEEICRMYINGGTVMKIAIEKVGQSTAEIHVANALNAMGRRISVENESLVLLKPAGRKKQDRIEAALEWPLNNQKLLISDRVPQKYSDHIRQEMSKFPYGSDDAIDALSYVYDIIKEYRFPHSEEQRTWTRTMPTSASSAGY